MRRMFGPLLLIGVLPVIAVTSGIYGDIYEGNGPIGEGTKVEVKCGTQSDSTTTDADGSYRLYVQAEGKCTLTVHVHDQTPSVEIQSYDRPVRYNLVVNQQADGTYRLRRR